MGFLSDLFLDAVVSALDSAERALDHAQDVVDATLGDPKEEGIKRGYEKAANEFEPLVAEIEREYQEVIYFITQTNKTYDQKTQYLLNKIQELNEEKQRLISRRDSYAKQRGVSVQNLSSFVHNPQRDLYKYIINERIAQMKKAEQSAYIEASAKFNRKITQMRNRLQECKRAANENLRKRIELVEDCLAEIAELQKQIAAIDVLG